MTIPISTTKDKIFKQYLTIMNGILSSDRKLSGLEIDVLEKMLYIDYCYGHLPKDKRDIILFHKKTKDKIRESVYGISTNSLNNVFTQLRKKGAIVGKSLRLNVPIKEGKIVLEFKLELNAEEDRRAATGNS
jgi:hypothetical protein